jgi:NitT/TauT family transport system substrate-binding protein
MSLGSIKFFGGGVLALALVASLCCIANAEPLVKGDGGQVRLLTSPFGTNAYPPFIMKKFGLDKKYGFELVLVPGLTTQARTLALRSNAADLTTLDWLEVARLRGTGLDLISIAPFLRWGADFVIVREDSKVKNLGDLRGKKLGEGAKSSLNYIIERTVAKNIYKLDLEKDASIYEGAGPLLMGLLESGQIDDSEQLNALTPEAIVSGKFKVLFKISDLVSQLGLPDTPYLQYTALKSFVQKNPQNTKAFVAAYREAVEILRTNDEVWIEKGKDLQQSPAAAAIFRREARTDIWNKYKPETEADIKKVFKAMMEAAGPEFLGVTELPDDFMTLAYQ